MIDSPALLSYSEHVFKTVREEILAGVRRPGDRLVELDLAREFGVSQGPVREALVRLREQRLVITLPHRGTFVSEISMEEARDIYRVRVVLEGYAHERALARLTDEDFAALEADIAVMITAAETGSFTEYISHDMRFHRRVFERAESAALLVFWDYIEAKTLKFAAVASLRVFDDVPRVARSHERLLECMRRRDPAEVQRELEWHLNAIWIEIDAEENGP